MTAGHKFTVALAVALAVLLGWAVYGWTREHEAHAVLMAQEADAKATQAALDAKEKQNQAQLASQLQTFEQMKRSVQTPQQIAQALPTVLPAMPEKIAQVTQEQANAVVTANLPNAPKLGVGDLIIPAADAKSFYDSQVDCKENEAKLYSCQETVSNQKSQIASKDAVIKDQDIALKGGTRWKRVGTAAKWVAVGIATGFVLKAVNH
jgi:predicted ribosome quality control (RQC) complex YloA/Tae2 family protein